MRTIAVINQKGGCGKTTTVINLAACLAELGHRTLVVDVDPQSHCAVGLGVPEHQIDAQIGQAMMSGDMGKIDTPQMVWQIARKLDLAPSTVSLAKVERQLSDAPDRDLRLARVLKHFKEQYDYCLIDCPPNIGLLTFNALRASGEVIVPVETAYFAMKGARKQAELIRILADRCGQNVMMRVLPTMYDEQVRLSRDIMGDLGKHFGEKLLPLSIRYDVKLKEAASFGQPIGEYDATARGYHDYAALAHYLLEHAPRLDEQIEKARTMGGNGSATLSRASVAKAATHGERGRIMGSDRASELVRRAKALSERTQRMQERLESDPDVKKVIEQDKKDEQPITEPTARQKLTQKLAVLYGVKVTGGGTLFVQPGRHARRVSIAGDFNGWSPAATPMKLNERLNVWEACVALPPGKYQYRLVVDDEWMTDPHNTVVEPNAFGQLNNVVEVATGSR